MYRLWRHCDIERMSLTSCLLHCQFVTDLLFIVGKMLQSLLVQACFPQHLVLVQQQLAVLVVHLVWRCLDTHTQSCMIETKAGDVLVPFLCLYKQKWNITGAAGWISVYAVQETASFFKYICIFLLTLAFCITQIEQRQEADCSYQERASESELYCSSDQTGRDSTNTEKSVERLHCNSDASVRHLHHHMKSPLEFKQDKMRQSVKPVVFSWTPRWSLQPSRSLPGGDTRWRSRSRRPAAQGATATVGTVSPTRNIMWT